MEAMNSVVAIEFPIDDVAQVEAISEEFSKVHFGTMKECMVPADG
jgi:hypothetical protein